jgi:glycosyltransferase involved in cell wall biosynthesis
MVPRVSVIIAAYNAQSYIDETVRSVLAQTHPAVEIIVVDDGSTDGTIERLAAFGDRIKLHQQANGGAAAARNAGARKATGEWIAFLDADDLWLPRKLECELMAADAPLVYTNRYNIGERGELPEVQSDVTQMLEGDVFVELMLRGNFITSSSVMLRREVFEQLGGFYEGLSRAEDYDMWLRVAERHPVRYCHEPLVRYRFHASGKSRNHGLMRLARERIIARALASERGRTLGWMLKRRIWATTWQTSAWAAGQVGARGAALADYSRAAIAWPLSLETYKEALKLCLP